MGDIRCQIRNQRFLDTLALGHFGTKTLWHHIFWHRYQTRPSPVLSTLSSFQPVTVSEICRLIRRAPCKHCPLNPLPTWLVKRATDVLASTIAAVCNASLQSGSFPDCHKEARVTARLKKSSLNPDDLNSFHDFNSFRLISLSKIIEQVVVKQFMNHADLNGLLPARQSAYRRFHSESVVLVFHNDTVRAIDDGHVAPVLLDLSSAFDSVDHSTCFLSSRDSGPLSQRSAHAEQYAQTKTNTNPN